MIFFNSSMPRSGSTLMQNILAQNTDIHATPTDGFLELIYGARANYTSQAEFKAQDAEQMQKAWLSFCREGMKGYCAGLSDKAHTCLKSRGIGDNYKWFEMFMGTEPKVIIMVRNIKSVMASMEKVFRASPEKSNQLQNPSEMRGLTTESRVQQWLNGAPVGLALQRLQQMNAEDIVKKCCVVRFEDLCKNPEREMNKVYQYLELPEFIHDYEHVEQVTQEDDAVYGMTPTLHKVRKKVEFVTPDYIDVLSEGLCRWLDENCHGYQKDMGYI